MKILKFLLFKVWQRSRKYADVIHKRGPEKYAEYTADFIFDSVLKSYGTTFRLLKRRPDKWWRLWLVPKIYFDSQIEPLIAKFPIYRSEFQKMGRNVRILVKTKKGDQKIIKKKQFNPEKHTYIGKAS